MLVGVLIALNATWLSLLAFAYREGWVDEVIAGDSSGICFVIVAVLAAGVGLAFHAAWRADRLGRAADLPDATSGAMTARTDYVRYTGGVLVLLGLIGTVVGFIMALSGVDASTASDPSAIAPMVGRLLDGMGVALYTTLVGALGNLWLGTNLRVVRHGHARLRARLAAS